MQKALSNNAIISLVIYSKPGRMWSGDGGVLIIIFKIVRENFKEYSGEVSFL